MAIPRNHPKRESFNANALLPFELRLQDFEIAMQDVYDLFHDVNTGLLGKGLERLDDFLRPAIMSGLLSDLLTASMSKHSRTLTQNNYFNGHPDLVLKGVYPNDSVKAGTEGVEIKTTRKGGAQSIRTVRGINGWRCSSIKLTTLPSQHAKERRWLSGRFYLGQVTFAGIRGVSSVRGLRLCIAKVS